MDWQGAIPWIVALGGGAGIGAGVKALVDTIKTVRSGVSAREGKRRLDIVQQRDDALAEAQHAHARAAAYRHVADVAYRNAEVARRNEQRAREYAADLRLFVIEQHRVRRDALPDWPVMEDRLDEDTLTRATLEGIRADIRAEDDTKEKP